MLQQVYIGSWQCTISCPVELKLIVSNSLERLDFCKLLIVNILLSIPSGLFRDNLQHRLGDFARLLSCSLQVIKK